MHYLQVEDPFKHVPVDGSGLIAPVTKNQLITLLSVGAEYRGRRHRSPPSFFVAKYDLT